MGAGLSSVADGGTGFELFPALDNRWDDVAAATNPAAVRRRFELLTDALGLDRPPRARVRTLARILQDIIWDTNAGAHHITPVQIAIAAAPPS
jgi:hypothetical protein